ncbi:hypothetical protein J6590_086786 [Homalodisca vitripennis]|nr:hypothetical protein J6590_086786 [Homalodisca vitripennis]
MANDRFIWCGAVNKSKTIVWLELSMMGKGCCPYLSVSSSRPESFRMKVVKICDRISIGPRQVTSFVPLYLPRCLGVAHPPMDIRVDLMGTSVEDATTQSCHAACVRGENPRRGKHGNLKLKHGSSDTSFERAHLVELNAANRISKGLSNQKWRVVLGTHYEVHYALPFLTGSSYSDAVGGVSLY